MPIPARSPILTRLLLTLPLLLAACGGDPESAPPGASFAGIACEAGGSPMGRIEEGADTPDLSCAGQPSPRLECGDLTWTGATRKVFDASPLGYSTIEAYAVDPDGNEELLAEVETGEDGSFGLTLPVLPEGWSGRAVGRLEGYRVHDGYFLSRPALTSFQQDIGLMTLDEIDFAAARYGLGEIDRDLAFVDPLFVDCAGRWVPGVIVEIEGHSGRGWYINAAGEVDPEQTMTAPGQEGGALFVNVALGPLVARAYRANPDGSKGELLGEGRGVARAGHWTAIQIAP